MLLYRFANAAVLQFIRGFKAAGRNATRALRAYPLGGGGGGGVRSCAVAAAYNKY